MKHDQVSERGVTSAHRTQEKEEEEKRENLSLPPPLFLRVVDIRTRIRRLVG